MAFSEFIEDSKLFVQKIIKIIFFVPLFWGIVSCGNKENEPNHQQGEMTIFADPSNQNLLEALTEIYTMKYPKVHFSIVYKPENQILQDLLDTVTSAAFINKPLSEKQTKYLAQKTDVTPRSTLLAYDAVVFITDIDNPLVAINMDELKSKILEGENQVVFDNGNSGNFNTVRDVLQLELDENQSVQALDNADEVIEFVQKSTGSIGVIGLNEISETANPKIKEILKEVKILPVLDENNKIQEPTVPNILAMNYPFFKGVYFIVREPGFGIGSGFSRFAGSNQGQLIVKREGLQPNYLYDREVQINLQSVE